MELQYPPFKPTARQIELATVHAERGTTHILASGAIRSGKTQAAASTLILTAMKFPGQYLVSRATYRELKDSTQRAMMYGDGGLPPLIPPELLHGGSLEKAYRASDEKVTLRNGAEIIFRSLETHGPEKVRGLTLSGALIDQIEELRYGEGEHLFDEVVGRLSVKPRKLLCVANPAGKAHWVYRRWIERPMPGYKCVHFTMRDNAVNLPNGYVDQMESTRVERPAWYRTFVLGEWGAIEDAAFQVYDASLLDEFSLDEAFDRFEAADYGLNGAPWALFAVDHDGNMIAVDMLYEREKLPSEVAARVLEKRRVWKSSRAVVDPSIWHRMGTKNKWGAPAKLADEFIDNGVYVQPANHDPRAGYARVRELLKPDPEHRFPTWHPRAGEPGSPRLFFVREGVAPLLEELREAPTQPFEKRDGGEIVDPEWESRHGHSVAMLRYAVMTRPEASPTPPAENRDPRSEVWEVIRRQFGRRPDAVEPADYLL